MSNDFWEFLDRLSDLLQVLDYIMLVEDASNNDLMLHLQQQDTILNEQTDKYLKEIIKQNNKIINLLERNIKNGS